MQAALMLAAAILLTVSVGTASAGNSATFGSPDWGDCTVSAASSTWGRLKALYR